MFVYNATPTSFINTIIQKLNQVVIAEYIMRFKARPWVRYELNDSSLRSSFQGTRMYHKSFKRIKQLIVILSYDTYKNIHHGMITLRVKQWQNILAVSNHSLIVCKTNQTSRKPCFCTENLSNLVRVKPWILEVNLHPSLC